jgi:hypothetical protein
MCAGDGKGASAAATSAVCFRDVALFDTAQQTWLARFALVLRMITRPASHQTSVR